MRKEWLPVVIIASIILVATVIGVTLYIQTSSSVVEPYIVQSGDSLYSIAEKYSIPWLDLAYANNISYPYNLALGESLLIPTYDPICEAHGLKTPIKDSGNITYGNPTFQSESNVNPDKKIILRFDDGYQDFWDNALPILAQYGYHAILAIIDAYQNDYFICGSYTPIILNGHQTAYYMNWPELQWLNENGFEISDHTLNHYNMSSMNKTELYYQVNEGQFLFHEHGIYPKTLTLPYGNGYGNQTVYQAIFSNGLEYIYTVTGVDNASTAIYPYNKVFVQWHDIDILDNESLSTFENIVNLANSSYVVGLTFHSIGNDAVNDTYETNTPNFAADMQYLHENEFDVIMPWDLPGINLTEGQ